ncbi:NADP-specific glutamate dehydrogenase [Lunatimonas salinarum]|uniref:NADP-specific glutamate dehydrogenase n=1 Tax=Lunatimonas salinarum TaxID=1774590 RepID=UPI001ADFDBBD|nr:NADP-specific glutamate dehydrogenase [Lunatimonas salinarum]
MSKIDYVLNSIKERNPGEPEFHQAVLEVFDSIEPVLSKNSKYLEEKVFERMAEPERIITFRVCWTDDNNQIQVNRGYRVQMNGAMGPYKGGLRFHPSLNLSILKFLAFEQTFKNALTGLPLGAGKGGADFNPKHKSDREIMRFCQAWMLEAYRHIGHFTDIPAGDIGVGEKEIGYLFGAFKKIKNEFQGSITGKGPLWGGSFLRPEATGYGLVHFAEYMLAEVDKDLANKVCLVSGSGNVSQFAIEKLIHDKAKVVAFSDSTGFIHDEEGVDEEKLAFLKVLKNEKRESIAGYAEKYKSAKYYEGTEKRLWSIPAECAFPCATQNELDESDVQDLSKNGAILIAEGANMPLTDAAIKAVQHSNIIYAPGKAANAGGVAISGLEMTQNRLGRYWSRSRMETELRVIMQGIHENCQDTMKKYSLDAQDYLNAANIAGFERVAKAMVAQGSW